MKGEVFTHCRGYFWCDCRIAGAFAAAAVLKAILPEYLLGVFETGVQYQFIRTLAILACGALLQMKLGAKSQKYFSLRQFALSSASFVLVAAFMTALTGIKWFWPYNTVWWSTIYHWLGSLLLRCFEYKEVTQ